MDERQALIATVRELREACAAAMRVIADLDSAHALGMDADTRQQRFVDECKIVGVQNGFGKRADDLLRRVAASEGLRLSMAHETSSDGSG